MLETSTNGAGAAVEAAAAGCEDQGGVDELGFVAGGRVAPAGVPDPELVEQAKRRSFTAKYKLEILAKAAGRSTSSQRPSARSSRCSTARPTRSCTFCASIRQRRSRRAAPPRTSGC